MTAPRTVLIALLCLLATAAAAAVAAEPDPAPAARATTLQRFEFSELCMGTRARVVLYAPAEPDARLAARAALDRLHELDSILSDYKPDSELSRLSRAPLNEPIPISHDLFRVLQRASEISEATGGAFDITAGPIVRLWREARKTKTLPTDDQINAALARVDWRALTLDPAAQTVTITKPGLILDPGGIAKGYAVQEAVNLLKSRGHPSCLIALSGDIAAGDAPPGEPGWTIAPSLHFNGGQPESLANAACSTSGDDFQFVEIEGVRYSHIIDPRTGRALTDRRAARCIAQDGMTADAVGTALCVMREGEPSKVFAVLPALQRVERAQQKPPP